MTRPHLICLFVPLLLIGFLSFALAGEVEDLKGAAEKFRDGKQTAQTLNQKLALQNAAEATAAAVAAIEAGDKKKALSEKRKALKWAITAVRECLPPPAGIDELVGAIGKEKGWSKDSVGRFKDLMDLLLLAKKLRNVDDPPMLPGMGLDQLYLALMDLVDHGGWDGWRPEKAFFWYLEATWMCADVQELLDKILEYMAAHTDDTGIPDISAEAMQQLKDMVDRLYKLKEANDDEGMMDLIEEIRQFLKQSTTETGAKRRAHMSKELAEEEQRERERGQQSSTLSFNAIENEVKINREYMCEVETISITAIGDEDHEIALDPTGERLRPPDGIEYGGHGEHFSITLPEGLTPDIVTLASPGRRLMLLARDFEEVPGGHPIDGLTDILNGRVRETLQLPASMTCGEEFGPGDYTVTVEGAPVTPIATCGSEIAISGTGIPRPEGDKCDIEVTSPTGEVWTAIAPAWGYELDCPEVTTPGASVPITVVVFGLPPDTLVTLEFTPTAGQTITPLVVLKPAGELMAPTVVAELVTMKLGVQSFSMGISWTQ